MKREAVICLCAGLLLWFLRDLGVFTQLVAAAAYGSAAAALAPRHMEAPRILSRLCTAAILVTLIFYKWIWDWAGNVDLLVLGVDSWIHLSLAWSLVSLLRCYYGTGDICVLIPMGRCAVGAIGSGWVLAYSYLSGPGLSSVYIFTVELICLLACAITVYLGIYLAKDGRTGERRFPDQRTDKKDWVKTAALVCAVGLALFLWRGSWTGLCIVSVCLYVALYVGWRIRNRKKILILGAVQAAAGGLMFLCAMTGAGEETVRLLFLAVTVSACAAGTLFLIWGCTLGGFRGKEGVLLRFWCRLPVVSALLISVWEIIWAYMTMDGGGSGSLMVTWLRTAWIMGGEFCLAGMMLYGLLKIKKNRI